MSNLLIKNAQIVTMNASEDIITGDIQVVNSRICEIGSDLEPTSGEKVLDATNRTVIPGFVQTHIHLCQTLFRGKGDELELLDWLKKRIWPLEASLDEESIYYSAMLGIGELLQSDQQRSSTWRRCTIQTSHFNLSHPPAANASLDPI